MRVTNAEFIKNYGTLAEGAHRACGHYQERTDRLMVVSAREYGRFMRRRLRAIRPEDLSEEDVALIGGAKVPAGESIIGQ